MQDLMDTPALPDKPSLGQVLPSLRRWEVARWGLPNLGAVALGLSALMMSSADLTWGVMGVLWIIAAALTAGVPFLAGLTDGRRRLNVPLAGSAALLAVLGAAVLLGGVMVNPDHDFGDAFSMVFAVGLLGGAACYAVIAAAFLELGRFLRGRMA